MIVQGREVVLGIDVASHQHPFDEPIDWAQVAAAGYRFVYVKATEGTRYRNPWLARDITGARAAGLETGAYHWMTPGVDGAAQGRYFLAAVDGLELTLPGSSPDVEQAGVTAAQVDAFMDTVPGVDLIYIGAYFQIDARPASWTGHPLWLAAYGPNRPNQDPIRMSAPVVGEPWRSAGESWSVWQFSSKGGVPGVPSVNVDRNVADLAWFSQVARPTPSAPSGPSPSEEDEYMARHQLFQTGPDLKLMAEVGIGTYGIVMVRTQTDHNSNFTPWLPLTSDEDPQPFGAVEVTAGTNADGRQEIVAYSPDGKCGRKVRNTDGTWRKWSVEE